MVDVLSEADTTGYYLAVVPTEGNYFLSGKYVNKKTLSPLLKVNSKTTSTKDWECYWFVEDSSIDITKEGYLPIGGLGWKCLNKKTNITFRIMYCCLLYTVYGRFLWCGSGRLFATEEHSFFQFLLAVGIYFIYMGILLSAERFFA